VARDQIIVVTAPDHQLLKRKPITPSDLMEVEWVLRERGSGTRSVFEDALVEFGLKAQALRIALESDRASFYSVSSVIILGSPVTILRFIDLLTSVDLPISTSYLYCRRSK
jgi:DNA-binding transcriptional LysR family regulator